jgi:predicted nucleic acid-binding protein
MLSAMLPTSPIYGIDTFVFVRILTGHPQADFEATANALQQLLEVQPKAGLLVSNQVIGEAYIALQFHYEITKSDSRHAIHEVLSNEIVAPLNGSSLLKLLQEEGGCGLIDRLIAQDYDLRGATILTNDRRMANLPNARLLSETHS